MPQVQEHDHEEEEDHDGPGIDDDLDGGQEVGFEEHVDPRQRGQRGHHEEEARHRVLPGHHGDGAPDGHPAEHVEEEVGAKQKIEEIGHGFSPLIPIGDPRDPRGGRWGDPAP